MYEKQPVDLICVKNKIHDLMISFVPIKRKIAWNYKSLLLRKEQLISNEKKYDITRVPVLNVILPISRAAGNDRHVSESNVDVDWNYLCALNYPYISSLWARVVVSIVYEAFNWPRDSKSTTKSHHEEIYDQDLSLIKENVSDWDMLLWL